MSQVTHTSSDELAPDRATWVAAESPEAIAEAEAQKRASFIEGLRQVAGFLEDHPTVPLPYLGSYAEGSDLPSLPIYLSSFSWEQDTPSEKAQLTTIARAFGHAEKRVRGESFQVWREFVGVVLFAQARREEVCERIVLGSHEVTEDVPDPELLAKVPIIRRTRTVEDVRWECPPLLAGEQS